MSISERSQNENDIFEVRHPMARPKRATPVTQESRTHRSFHTETKISTIYERFTRTGQLPNEDRRASAQYGDVSHLNRDLSQLVPVVEETRAAVTAAFEREARKPRMKPDPQLPPEGGSTSPAPASAPGGAD